MKRIILMILRVFYVLPIWLFKIWLYGKSDKYTEEERYGFLHHITPKVNKVGRVTIDSHGLENLPKENGYIIFPNHQGLFDGLIFLESHERPFSIIMKKEVKSTILVKQIRLLLKAQIIDRNDVRQSMKVIKKMAEEVKEGRNYIIFAEGTRSKNRNEILDFKAGSFKSAMMAKSPIVPAAIIDSFKAFDSNSIKRITVQVHYLKPLYYEDYKDMKSHEIASYVETKILETIQKNTD
jgi:1-acyl-sn-glycerol-3-phosphate acyltransferase